MDDFSKYYLLDWLAMGFSLLGAYLLGNKNKLGFLSISLANAMWIFLGFTLMSSLGIGIGNIVFFIINVRGFTSWSRSDVKEGGMK